MTSIYTLTLHNTYGLMTVCFYQPASHKCQHLVWLPAFGVVAPKVWYDIPDSIRPDPSLNTCLDSRACIVDVKQT